jgi:hypothetical protein
VTTRARRAARTAFAAAWLAVQAYLIATAGARPDRALGFRMFAESGTVRLHVERVLDDGGMIPIGGDGEWEARDCAGEPHRFAWGRMVGYPAPWALDQELHSPYGADAGAAEARAALEWVAAHTPEDCQTLALRARVEVRRNGGAPERRELTVERAPGAR